MIRRTRIRSQTKNVRLIAAILYLTASSQEVRAAGKVLTQARWDLNDRPKIVINVADILTPSQREIINSGFTTFSVFTIGETRDGSGQTVPLFRTSCTVKYDTWEDRYDVNKLEPTPLMTEVVKDYKAWSSMCLEIVIDDPKLVAAIEQDAEVVGSLNIRQSTPDEGAKIKSWLVKQQSGFMQGLYAHMLGDFQYQHRSQIKVSIPKRNRDKPLGGVKS